ncbi:TPA: DNA primase [Vibrio vulnificus]|nr:DNA primase [Vibrio vulnificus]
MSYYKVDNVRSAASGNWLFILAALAPHVEPAIRKKPGRHVACPIHGGKDGFRLFKDAHITGGGVCNTCGSFHDGFELLKWLNRWNFKECLKEVGDLLNVEKTSTPVCSHEENKQQDPVTMFREPAKPWLVELKQEMEDRIERERLYSARLGKKIQEEWDKCVPFFSSVTEPMRLYLQNRKLIFNVEDIKKTDSLRFNPSMSYYDSDGNKVGDFPAIVSAIRNIKGEIITLHRTYITEDGKKAKVLNAKKIMSIPNGLDINGSSIRLGEPVDGVLGVAEGLETALSVFRATKIPVWSTVNATLMESFNVPEGVHTVLIWADRDRSKTGEISGYTLQAKLESEGINAYVIIPKIPVPPEAKGVDWNDVLISQGRYGFPSSQSLRNFFTKREVKCANN